LMSVPPLLPWSLWTLLLTPLDNSDCMACSCTACVRMSKRTVTMRSRNVTAMQTTAATHAGVLRPRAGETGQSGEAAG
jgi:hypothetical protein